MNRRPDHRKNLFQYTSRACCWNNAFIIAQETRAIDNRQKERSHWYAYRTITKSIKRHKVHSHTRVQPTAIVMQDTCMLMCSVTQLTGCGARMATAFQQLSFISPAAMQMNMYLQHRRLPTVIMRWQWQCEGQNHMSSLVRGECIYLLSKGQATCPLVSLYSDSE